MSQKNNKFLAIFIALLFILGLSLFVFFRGNLVREKIALFNCEKHGGNFLPADKGRSWETCYPKNVTLAVQKNASKIKIKFPNLKTGEKIISYPDKAKELTGNLSFVMPFLVDKGEQGKDYYLGFFYFDDSSAVNGNFYFYKGIHNVWSYFINQDIDSFNVISATGGSYSIVIKIEYWGKDNLKKEFALRSYYGTEKFDNVKECKEIGSIVNRERGDGKKYDVCIFDDSHECTLEAYDKGDCPVGGYNVSVAKTPAEKYGIANGFLFKNGTFVFPPDYMQCTIDDFYSGKCEMK